MAVFFSSLLGREQARAFLVEAPALAMAQNHGRRFTAARLDVILLEKAFPPVVNRRVITTGLRAILRGAALLPGVDRQDIAAPSPALRVEGPVLQRDRLTVGTTLIGQALPLGVSGVNSPGAVSHVEAAANHMIIAPSAVSHVESTALHMVVAPGTVPQVEAAANYMIITPGAVFHMEAAANHMLPAPGAVLEVIGARLLVPRPVNEVP